MDPKILEVLKRIIANPKLITEVVRTDNEYYFRFKEVTFSILFAPNRQAKYGPYSFYIYPSHTGPIDKLVENFLLPGADNPDISGFHSAGAGEEGVKFMKLLWDTLCELKPTPLDLALRKVLGN